MIKNVFKMFGKYLEAYLHLNHITIKTRYSKIRYGLTFFKDL